jgi:AbiV family abortive infection protein
MEAHRYRTALSVAILSIEEIGKYYLIKWTKDNEPNRTILEIKKHITKQERGSWFFVESAILEFMECISELGFTHKHVSELSDSQIDWTRSEEGKKFNSDLRDGLWPDGIMDKVIGQMEKKGIITDYETIKSGRLNKVKQAGFYSDIDDDIEYIDFFLPESVEKWLQRAETMCRRTQADALGTAKPGYFMTTLRNPPDIG